MDDHKTKTLKNLLSFSNSESLIYSEMIKRSEISAGELHRLTGLNRSRIYAVLKDMTAKGFCTERFEGRNRFYRSVKPSLLLKGIEQSWKIKKDIAEKAFQQLEVYQIEEQVHQNHIKLLNTATSTHQTYCNLLHSTNHELLSLIRPPFISQDKTIRREQVNTSNDLIKRGARVKVIASFSKNEAEWIIPVLIDMEASGYQVKIHPNILMKLTISDKSRVLLSLPTAGNGNPEKLNSLLIDEKNYVKSCIAQFERLWASGHRLNRKELNRNIFTTS